MLSTIIWKINSFIILILGILAIVIMCIVGYFSIRELTRTRHVENVSVSTAEQIKKEELTLGTFEKHPDSALWKAPLYVSQSYDYETYNKKAQSIRNYVYFNPKTRQTYWLRPKNTGLILTTNEFPERRYEDKDNPKSLKVIVYTLVEQDSDGNKRLNSNDIKKIAISDPLGKNFRIVVKEADSFVDGFLLDDQRISLMYKYQDKYRTAELDFTQSDSTIQEYEISLKVEK